MYGGNGHFQYSKSNNSKRRKQELCYICSACHLMVFNICVKFHENMSKGFKVIERTQKLLTDTQTQKRGNYIPHCIAYFVCRGYNHSYSSCVLHFV